MLCRFFFITLSHSSRKAYSVTIDFVVEIKVGAYRRETNIIEFHQRDRLCQIDKFSLEFCIERACLSGTMKIDGEEREGGIVRFFFGAGCTRLLEQIHFYRGTLKSHRMLRRCRSSAIVRSDQLRPG